MTALPTTPCRGCGKPIVFADVTKADGTPGKVPLDAKAPCYVLTETFLGEPKATRAATAFVTHFATCASANKFTKSAETQASAQDEIDDLRKRLQTALDRVAVLESRKPFSGAPGEVF